MTDEQLIADLIRLVPGAVKNHMVTKHADEVAPVLRAAIEAERKRCSLLAAHVAQEGMAIIAQAKASNDARLMVAADSAMRAARRISALIAAAPGACPTCKGTREVPSTLAPGMAIPCPDCKAPVPAAPPEPLAVVDTAS
jgi:hypothetical protein